MHIRTLAGSRHRPARLLAFLVVACAAAAGAGQARADDATSAAPLAELSLEELASIRVTTATRRDDQLNEIPAAVWVITQDDIRRSGALSIPEVLRLAPGLHVAQIDDSTWAISARGFNSRFSNKLLVLMDGRTLYSPAFGGVWWGAQTTSMEDIERIEVIRGPGGALWGANAVNGVINIITKRTAQTQGLHAAVEQAFGAGSNVSLRYGGTSAAGDWRVYAKHSDYDGEPQGIDTGNDGWRHSQFGARIDRGDESDSLFTLATEAYWHAADHEYVLPPSGYDGMTQDKVSGASILARWTRVAASGGLLTAQTYLDHTSFDGPYFAQTLTMLDADVQYAAAPAGRHRVLLGASARVSRDHLPETPFVTITDPRDTASLLSAFVQDDYALRGDDLVLTAGMKLEHQDDSGSSWLPNLRLRWRIDEASTAWAALSRAVRQPGRGEMDWHLATPNPVGSFELPFGGALPVYTQLHGNPDMKAESVVTAELGWRRTWSDFSLDVATYYSRYRRLRELQVLDLQCGPSGTSLFVDPSCLFFSQAVVSQASFVSTGRATARGGEIAASWQVVRPWRVTANYSFVDERTDASPGLTGGTAVSEPAKHIAQLRSSLYIGDRIEWDVFGRYVGSVRQFTSPNRLRAYVEVNSRIAWRPRPRLELALVGHNLLRKSHVEQFSELQDLVPSESERVVYAQLRWAL